MFGAMLAAWRARRGLSQLALALAARVSSRHLSFLETGRARPSAEMVLRLASVLGLGLPDQNDLLAAAGFERRFPEARTLSAEVSAVLTQIMRVHEPYPLVVLDASYEVRDLNRASKNLFGSLLGRTPTAPNLLALLFDPEGLRPFVVGWDALAERLLSRLRREMWMAPRDARLAQLSSRLLAFPGVPVLSFDPHRLEATLPLRLDVDGTTLSFVTTMTTFSNAHDVLVSELRIESFYPLDALTEAHCRESARHSVGL